jgi:hypothetical protein
VLLPDGEEKIIRFDVAEQFTALILDSLYGDFLPR